ncbi:Mitochondrial intermembrane space import and assembly protein 40 [Zancudomyces culisetae]|uniref:Mitochondrial intermembrane space import and assembly protein 40 n=1 Tax=Zancudomyces culisetae TaxID=1213189 RepID=A0A1R1PJY5_ZANCU|nr:Mitochondrial intermembrane space import and assembly protein 40 [Zancudomyces culisetae]|eukprot:OMH81278.1 Mitochondrial intermembrane space import and assembly protein 40 [Zancudomyces culisetae]
MEIEMSATNESREQEEVSAFNEETGEINWDCPCLGGMAHGTCGEEFKAAFSCFVYSTGEPKGMECIDAFQAMQDCFRAHPEEYSSQLNDEESDEDQQKEDNQELQEQEVLDEKIEKESSLDETK